MTRCELSSPGAVRTRAHPTVQLPNFDERKTAVGVVSAHGHRRGDAVVRALMRRAEADL